MNWQPFNNNHQSAGGFVLPQGNGISPQEFAFGGKTSNAQAMGYASREAPGPVQHDGGLFASAVPGRTDKLDTLVPGGAYVVPADVVSGLGQGNTMAGSAVLDKMFSTGPYGSKIPHSGGSRSTIPTAPSQHRASGGRTGSSHVPIIAAGGEYLISPEIVTMIGGGDMKLGHKILDQFVLHTRKKTTDEMRKLPGPKKGRK